MGGTILIGNQDGQFYTLRWLDESERPKHNQGTALPHQPKCWERVMQLPRVDAEGTEPVRVCCHDMKACFMGASTPALTPTRTIAASIDTVYCFKSGKTTPAD